MGKDWKIASKNRKNYYEKAFNIWKLNFLPTKIAMHQLKIVNHNLKLNTGLKMRKQKKSMDNALSANFQK
jgi:hypothetical protein